MADVWDMRFNTRRVYKATGAVALALTVAPGRPFRLSEYRIHMSGAGADELLTVTLDSVLGAPYDVIISSPNTFGETDIVRVTEENGSYFGAGDELDFALANTGTVTYGLEVITFEEER